LTWFREGQGCVCDLLQWCFYFFTESHDGVSGAHIKPVASCCHQQVCVIRWQM